MYLKHVYTHAYRPGGQDVIKIPEQTLLSITGWHVLQNMHAGLEVSTLLKSRLKNRQWHENSILKTRHCMYVHMHVRKQI